MKKEFTQLIKDIRLALRDDFKAIVSSNLSVNEMSDKLTELEEKQNIMLAEAGYDSVEYHSLMKEYFMDFSSPNPDEWVVKHDPENAQIIASTGLKYQ